MLRIRALNRESSSDEDIPVIRKEAQEEIALELYNKALKLQSHNQFTESREILLKLVNENIPELECQGGLPKSMSTLKYSCFLNIGNSFIESGELVTALDNFSSASELDGTDVTLWCKIGKLALKINRFRQAIFAFTKGLECNESHWPCLDQLISILYAVRDTIGCLVYISKALMLDCKYVKGLVLRKKIYENNPATREYYQSYNPDIIWEPPLDTKVTEVDEEEVLHDMQKLIDRINDVEESLGPKPLPTIPLPRALDDYTWIELGRTIIDLHHYITNNNLSHFSLIDMSKCMSQKREVEPISIDAELSKDAIKKEEILPEIKPVSNGDVKPEDDKVEVQAVIERRFSQTSDNNTEQGQENTPVQTDNDDEVGTEQENEDQDDNNFESKPFKRAHNRGTKRKRDLLSDLQIWGWHSKRKTTKKSKQEKDFTVEEALHRIIPKHLLQTKISEIKCDEDSMNTMDIYNMYVQDHHVNFLTPIHSPKSVDGQSYFGTEYEKDDVLTLWTKRREYCDSVLLIQEFVISVSKFWNIQWPKELIPVYMEAYRLFREHFDHPQVFLDDSPFEETRDDALATILYGELMWFSCNKDENRIFHMASLGFLQNVSVLEDKWGEEFPSFFNRVHWLRTYIFRKEGNTDLAIKSLQLIQEVVTEEEQNSREKYVLSLPNCHRCSLISMETNEKLLKYLDMIKSLTCLEDLYNAEKYVEVADIIKETFACQGTHPTYGKIGRPAQIGMLLHALWFTDITQCFIWTEECLYECVEHFLKPRKDPEKWEKLLEKCLAIFYEIINKETVSIVDSLSEDKRSRMVESLAKIVLKQLSNGNGKKLPVGSVTPWILLHFVLLREEHRQQASKKVSHIKSEKTDSPVNEDTDLSSVEIPPSIAILFSGHEFLGPKGWCLSERGRLLHFILDSVLERLDTPIFESLRDKIDIHIEQSLFCLYQHPSKKNKMSRHLADHNVDPLPLTWQRSFQLYEFYGPDCLPEFNSFKNASISSDLEQLFQRIIALVPSTCDPQTILPRITDFIHGRTDVLPDPIDFPIKVRAIYYLLGDFYFKQREFNRCIKYFITDLCINPARLDSWACLALSYTSQLESKLNYCKKMKSEMEFLDKAKCAKICFKQALKFSNDIVLWIEHGAFEYMVHSFCSRVLKYESDTLSMEKFEYLENQKNDFLDSSGQSFENALELYEPDETDADERWLQYYILGKIAEKKQKEPNEYLQYYLTALNLLHENNAQYPDKIIYSAPQHLSVEVLEVHYRIYASILKYIELHEGKIIASSIGKTFKRTLGAATFPKKKIPSLPPQPVPTSESVQLPPNSQPQITHTQSLPSTQVSSSQPQVSNKSQPLPQNKDSPVLETPVAPQATDFSSAFHKFIQNSSFNGDIQDDIDEEMEITEDKLQEDKARSLKAVTTENKVETKMDTSIEIVEPDNQNVDTKASHEIMDVVNIEEEGEKNITEKKVEKECDGAKEPITAPKVNDPSEDVIILSDSDDDDVKPSPETKDHPDDDNKDETPPIIEKTKPKVTNVQDLLDQMMVETMKNSLEHPMDLDVESVLDSGPVTIEPKKSNPVSPSPEKAENKISSPEQKSPLSGDCRLEMDCTSTDGLRSRTDENESKPKTPSDVASERDLKSVEGSCNDDADDEEEEGDVEDDGDEGDDDNEGSKKDDTLNVKADEKSPKSEDNETDGANRKSSDSSSSSGSSSSSSSTSDSDSDDDCSSTSSSSSSEESNDNMSSSEIAHLVNLCVHGLEQCIVRLPQNFKALYRLAHLFFNYKPKKDLSKCKQLLLSEYKCKDNIVVSGLFSDRKVNNFFNGIWRIPSSEIDRPGSLSAHMSRCVSLLLQVLRNTNDHKILLELCLQFRKSPDQDKIYIKDSERIQFSEQAMTMCMQCLQTQIKNLSTMNHNAVQKLLQDIFKVYQKVQKHMPNMESKFANMLSDVYKSYMKDKIPENLSPLELAIRFCLQSRSSEKSKPIQNTVPLPRTPAQLNNPVLPAPINVAPPINPPLKRVGSGRPRGRPPLPKVPGQPRTQRGRSPVSTNPYNWQKPMIDQKLALEYLSHYQEELLKQYSQSLSMNQLTHLNQYMTQGMGNFMQTTQSSLLNPSNLVKQMASGMSSLLNTQPKDNLNQLNQPNLKKKITESTSTSLQFTTTLSSSASAIVTSSLGTASPSALVGSSTSLPGISSNSFTGLNRTTSLSGLTTSCLTGLTSAVSSLAGFANPSLTGFNTTAAALAGLTNPSSMASMSPEELQMLSNYVAALNKTSMSSSVTSKSNIPATMNNSFLGNPNNLLSASHMFGPYSAYASYLTASTKVKSANLDLKRSSSSGMKYTTANKKMKSSSSGAKGPGTTTVTKTSSTVAKPISTPVITKSPTSTITRISPSNLNSNDIPISKGHPITPVDIDKQTNLVMKDRPNLSITPVLQTTPPPPPISTSPYMPQSVSPNSIPYSPAPSGSPGKTLQEKLADKKKQNSSKQLGKGFDTDMIPKDLNITPISTAKKNFNVPNIPASLSVSKAHSITSLGIEPSLSISQVQAKPPMKPKEKTRDPELKKSKPKLGIPNTINIPQSLSYQPHGLNMSPKKEKERNSPNMNISLTTVPNYNVQSSSLPKIAATIIPVDMSKNVSLPRDSNKSQKTEAINMSQKAEAINMSQKKDTNIPSKPEAVNLSQSKDSNVAQDYTSHRRENVTNLSYKQDFPSKHHVPHTKESLVVPQRPDFAHLLKNLPPHTDCTNILQKSEFPSVQQKKETFTFSHKHDSTLPIKETIKKEYSSSHKKELHNIHSRKEKLMPPPTNDKLILPTDGAIFSQMKDEILKNKDQIRLPPKKDPAKLKSSTMISNADLPPNIPVSLSVIRNPEPKQVQETHHSRQSDKQQEKVILPERKSSSDDDVIFIE